MSFLDQLCLGLPVNPLPPLKPRDETVPHAPKRTPNLTKAQQKIALQNALRYFEHSLHPMLAKEFAEELETYGHIYMYRFTPTFPVKAYPVEKYPTKTVVAASIIHMIMNNLDPAVAQFPQELVTYGGNGQVFSNWAQFWLTVKYLCEMDNEQTLVMYSGHPMGLFPSPRHSPRMVITNGMVIPNYSSREDYEKMFAMGVTMYGQMTAGSYCYIGPQGIVHGTVLTVMNAGRKYLGLDNLAGKVFVTSGLGGMSGAQAKAAVICGCVGVIAEVSYSALKKRYDQKWLNEIISDLDEVISRIRQARYQKEATSIGYHGNIVLLWEKLVEEYNKTGEMLVDLGSDQTSCHDVFNGGYYPVQLSFDEAQKVMENDQAKFTKLVQDSLRRQIAAINTLAEKGMKFWDYGNAFLLEARKAGADVETTDDESEQNFRYPSYVQDIMGDIFSLGFGPFRWVCVSGSPEDLHTTDLIANDVMRTILRETIPLTVQQQYKDNIRWIEQADEHNLACSFLTGWPKQNYPPYYGTIYQSSAVPCGQPAFKVVGSQARILYSDQKGRTLIAAAFNKARREGTLKGPIVISRDHHDVSGTDSPYRETSNIKDGSAFTADMAVQNCIGDSFRGATWVALHNGGGVGWGEVTNGGFGLVLDGSEEASNSAAMMLDWDVNNGVARRSWSGNTHAQNTIQRAMDSNTRLNVTMPYTVASTILESAFT